MASPRPAEMDQGDALSAGLTLEEAAQLSYEEHQAQVLGAWLACAFPDSYAQLRVDHAPRFHATASLTAQAGADPLAGAPVGVLDGRVVLERVPFSQVQMLLLGQRVDAALDACHRSTNSASIDVDAVRVFADADAVDAVRQCLDDADERGALGRSPGRTEVDVQTGSAAPVDGS